MFPVPLFKVNEHENFTVCQKLSDSLAWIWSYENRYRVRDKKLIYDL